MAIQRSSEGTASGSGEASEARAPDRNDVSPAARRALAEAEARRAAVSGALPPETGGRGGLEPVRYGDWEVKGLAADF